MIMRSRFFYTIILLMSLFCLLVIFRLTFFTWLVGDDFGFYNSVSNSGVFTTIINFYIHWDGRQLSPAGLYQLITFKYMDVQSSILIYFILLVGLVIFSVKISFKNVSICNSIIICSIFLLSLMPFFRDILFWQTGGVYIVFLWQSILIIYFFSYNIIKSKILILILIPFLSLNSQNIIVPVLSYFIVLPLFYKKYNIYFDRSQYLLYMISIFIGILITNLAPGNFIRLETDTKTLGFIDAFKFFPDLVYKSIIYGKYTFIAGFLVFLYLGELYLNKKDSLLLVLLFLILSISAISPFIFTPGLTKVRSLVVFAILCFPLGSCLGLFFLNIKKIPLLIRFAGLFSIFLIGIYLIVIQAKLMIEISSLMAKKDEFLKENSGSNDLVVYHIISNDSFFLMKTFKYDGIWKEFLMEYYNLNSYTEIE